MCRIKSEIYSTKVGWTWATWAKSRIGPIWFPFVIHMGLPMWVPHGTVLQIPSQSHMGCPYRTHIQSHMGPLLYPYLLLTGWPADLEVLTSILGGENIFSRKRDSLGHRLYSPETVLKTQIIHPSIINPFVCLETSTQLLYKFLSLRTKTYIGITMWTQLFILLQHKNKPSLISKGSSEASCKYKQRPAITAMHGPNSLVRLGD